MLESVSYLPPMETKEKAWKAIYEFLDYSTPFLRKHHIDRVTLALCGSVKRGTATCPRPKDKFCRELNMSIHIFERKEIEDEGLDIKEVDRIVNNACSVMNSTDEIINYLDKVFEGTVIPDIARQERCSDVDGWIYVPDGAYNNFIYDKEYYEVVDKGNEKVERICEPLTPNIGFMPDTAPIRDEKIMACREECECRTVEVKRWDGK